MTTEQMVANMRRKLNRPVDDDLFEYPGEYYQSLTEAHEYFYQLVASHRPQLLYQTAELTSSDGGTTFTLSDDHLGEMEVWRDPGPPRGALLTPTDPESGGHYYVEGRALKFVYAISGTIHVRWVPSAVPELDADTNSALPAYCDWAIIYFACSLMAEKPGFLGNPEVFMNSSMREWRGADNNPADMGVLGVISRQSAHQAYEGLGDFNQPWYRGIG